MKLPDLFRVVIQMIYDGKDVDEIFDHLSEAGMNDAQIDRIYSSVIGLISKGMEKTEIVFSDSYNLKRRVFTQEELSVISNMPGLLTSLLWGEISPEEFETTLTDLGGYEAS